jgi:WhiB family redox-sensing transcriptional regulator
MQYYDFPSLKDGDARWMENAECRGAEFPLFFPETMSDSSAAIAVSMCNRCPVQEDCARYAIINNIEYGIWGGLSPRARREIASSARKKDRTREQETYDTYTKHKNAGRTDPVKATSRDLKISTATVYHHVRIMKFKAIFEGLQND